MPRNFRYDDDVFIELSNKKETRSEKSSSERGTRRKYRKFLANATFDTEGMHSTGFTKIRYVILVIAVLLVLFNCNLVLSSSIYVGRHESTNISEQGPSAVSDDNLYVTLGIFSGRRDPEWSVPSNHPKFAEIKQLLDDAKTHHFTYSPESMPSRLGYKGFLVKTTKRGKLELIVGPETLKLQKVLLDTAPDGMLSKGIRNIVLKEITAGNVRAQEVAPLPFKMVEGTSPGEDNLLVTLGIFSGRPDPQWTVLSSNPKFTEINQLLEDARTGNSTYRPECMPARLGYKGFLVWATKTRQPELIVGPETVKLQKLLLGTVPDGILSQKIRNIVLKEITTGTVEPKCLQ